MQKGFLDQIVLSEEKIDVLFKQGFPVIKKWLDEIIAIFQINYLTFYTKWYTNGIYSNESFLSNHDEVANIRSKNTIFKKIVDYLHNRNIEVGCMLHLLVWEKADWGETAVLGTKPRFLADIIPENADVIMIDPLHPLSIQRIKKVIEEHISFFPEMDHLLLETEIICCDLLEVPYNQWALVHEKPLFESLSPVASDFSFQVTSVQNNQSFQEFTSFYEGQLLKEIDKTVNESDFGGEMGYVYQLNRGQYKPLEFLPHSDWWLLPWYYFGWGKTTCKEEMNDVKSFLTGIRKKHKKIWYIGDGTIACNAESIQGMFEFCQASGFEKYMACGIPMTDMGLRWLNVNGKMLEEMKILYRKLYSDPQNRQTEAIIK